MALYTELDTNKIRSQVGGNLVGSAVLLMNEVDSTNDLAKRYFQNNAPEGMVFLAESQTNGKGRSGRAWHSPPGAGIYLSVLLKPSIPAIQTPPLTLMAGVAAVKALNDFNSTPASLKWPNDILLNSKKLGGILCELVAFEDHWGVVIGIGVNVNHKRSQFPEELREIATSLYMENEESTDRTLLTVSILKCLDQEYQTFLKEGIAPLTKDWTRLTKMFGNPVSLNQGVQTISGTALGLDDQGSLVIRMENGQIKAFNSGEVTLNR